MAFKQALIIGRAMAQADAAGKYRVPTLAELKRGLLADNAKSANPLPGCGRCRFPMDLAEQSDIFPRLCERCGIERCEDLVRRVVATWGCTAAVAKLRALARQRPQS